MKTCPACQRRYTDDTLRFCLDDGAVLDDLANPENAPQTLVLPPGASPIDAAAKPANAPPDAMNVAALQADEHRVGEDAASAGVRNVPSRRNTIFISYSHHDRNWLEQFKVFLRPHFHHHEISAWDDRQIEPGTKWKDQIDSALDSACVAVLLVTPHFFDSEFIQNVELPRIREAARTSGLQIYWVAVRASAVNDTEIGEYQGLNNPAHPLAVMTPAEQDAKLVEICKEIKRRAKPIEISEQVEAARETHVALPPLRKFETHMSDIGLCLPDPQGRIWVGNSQQVKIFEIKHEQPVETWLRPRRTWKYDLPAIWRDQLVSSDWDGSLYQLSGKTGAAEQVLYQAGADDLPIHRIAVGSDGQLISARWDGTINIWSDPGSVATKPLEIVVPYLPLQLIPLPAGALAVVDEAHYLRTYDAAGQPIWTWKSAQSVRQAWACATEAAPHTFVLQTGPDRLVKISEGKTQKEEVRFEATINGVSRALNQSGEEWIVVALSDGTVNWLSTSLFSVVADNSVRLDFGVETILAISDPEQPNSLIALGVSSQGQLFSLNEQDIRRYQTPDRISNVVLDPTGRFLYLVSNDAVTAYRNPAIRAARCHVEIAGPATGTLEVGAFKKIRVKLRNSGAVPIHEIKAELASSINVIDAAKNKEQQIKPIARGEIAELEFSVLAKVHGDLTLDLRIEMTDEGGPPFSLAELSFSVESRRARSGHNGN